MRKFTIAPLAVLTALVMAACGAQTPSTSTSATSGAATSAASSTNTSATADALTGTTATADAMMSTTEAGATSESTSSTAETEATTGAMSGTTTAGTAEADATAGTTAGTAEATGNTIVDVAAADGRFTTLLTALQAAGLEETLSGSGPYTVFAPTDEAFASLPAGTLEALLADPTALESILTYHVAQGQLLSTDIAGQSTVPTLQGDEIEITASGSSVTLNGATTVTTADIQTSNGVIHVIDQVLLPPSVTLPAQ